MTNVKFNAAEVLKSLAGTDFPADKEDVIRTARRNGASEQILAMLKADLPEATFRTTAEVMKALGETVGEVQ